MKSVSNKSSFSRLHKWGITKCPGGRERNLRRSSLRGKVRTRTPGWLKIIREICVIRGYIFYSLLSSLYICRESSTNSPLFMQNKPNFLDAQINVSSFITKDYERNDIFAVPENKPNSKPIKANSNPIQSQFPKSQNELKLLFNKGL